MCCLARWDPCTSCVHTLSDRKKRISPDYFCCFAKPWKALELLLCYFTFLTGFFTKHWSDAPLKVIIDVSCHRKRLFRFHSYDPLAKGKQNIWQVPFHPTLRMVLKTSYPWQCVHNQGLLAAHLCSPHQPFLHYPSGSTVQPSSTLWDLLGPRRRDWGRKKLVYPQEVPPVSSVVPGSDAGKEPALLSSSVTAL